MSRYPPTPERAQALRCRGARARWAAALVKATLIFWVVHFIVQVVALRILIRQPSISLAGLLALLSTVISLIIVTAIVGGLSIHGPKAYIPATLIIWVTTALSDTIGARKIKASRHS